MQRYHTFLAISVTGLAIVACSQEVPGVLDGGVSDASTDDADVGAPPEDSGALEDVGPPDAGPACDCDDSFACTADTCASDGTCSHEVRHLDCPSGQYCDASAGCVVGAICATDADCMRPDACVLVACDPALRRCSYRVIDGDADGHAPLVCGGDDCNDGNARVHPDIEAEQCDGIDADCSGGPEPADAYGCVGAEVCDGGACVCASPAITCSTTWPVDSTICVDPTTDTSHCGDCTRVCARINEVCDAGACRCPSGWTLCDAEYACFDLASDDYHCGDCDTRCGEATCNAGACACPAGTTRCNGFDGSTECARVDSDWRHCGACGVACLGDAVCDPLGCRIEPGGFLRAFGNTAVSSASSSVNVERDPVTGALVAMIQQPVHDVMELPGPSPTLYRSGADHEVVHFDAAGDFVRRMAGTLRLQHIAARAGSLWVMGEFSGASATFAGATFARAGGSSGTSTIVVARIDLATGSLAWSRNIDITAGTYVAGIAADATGEITIAGFSWNDLDFGGGTLSRGTSNVGFVARYGLTGSHVASWRLPGRIHAMALDGAGAVVVHGQVYNPLEEIFTFGGELFAGSRTEGGFVAHHTPRGAHLHSFLAGDLLAQITPYENGVVALVRDTSPALRRYRYSGYGAVPGYDEVASTFSGDIAIVRLAIDGARIVAVGRHGGAPFTFGSRTLDPEWSGTRWIGTFDLATLDPLEYGQISTGAYSSIDVEVVGAGRYVVSGSYEGMIRLGDRAVVTDWADRGMWAGEIAIR